MTYNEQGKCTTLENLAGQITTTAWDCCHKVSETQPDGSTTTWDYDTEGRMIESSRLIPLDMTNVTWLTTCYEYDDLGRQTATWQTNYAAQVGLPVQATKHDQQGRILEYTDDLGNAIHVSYSNDGLIRTERRSDGGYKILARNPQGDALSLTGNLLLNEVVSRGVLPNGTCWERHDFGDDESGYKWTTRHVNMLKQETLKEKSAFGGSEVKTYISYTNYDKIERIAANGKPIENYVYSATGEMLSKTISVDGISFSINVGLGELTGSFGGNRSTVRCNKDCSKCKKGYTIETTTSWGGGTGGSWKWVTPIGIPIDVGFSWELDKSQWYFYDSCINREDSKSCATISVSIFAGKCFGIGPWIRHCFNIDGTYVYSDCGNGQNNFSIGVTWTQCYGPERFGGCISTRYSPDWLKFGKY